MQEDSDTPAFTLDAPAEAEHIASIRSFAAGVAAAHGAAPDDVADVRLAISELAGAIVARSPDGDVGLRITHGSGVLTFTIRPWEDRDAADDGVDPWELVTSLFEDARPERDQITFSLVLPPAA